MRLQYLWLSSVLAFTGVMNIATGEDTTTSTSTPKATASSAQSSPPKALAPKSGSQNAIKEAKDAKSAAAAASDKLTLDTTVVTGNRELPKVLYIVPWKKAELGQLPGEPFNSLIDETLMPVDREVFRREVQYYGVIAAKDQPAASAAGDSGK